MALAWSMVLRCAALLFLLPKYGGVVRHAVVDLAARYDTTRRVNNSECSAGNGSLYLPCDAPCGHALRSGTLLLARRTPRAHFRGNFNSLVLRQKLLHADSTCKYTSRVLRGLGQSPLCNRDIVEVLHRINLCFLFFRKCTQVEEWLSSLRCLNHVHNFECRIYWARGQIGPV